jgi:hypothetical protein
VSDLAGENSPNMKAYDEEITIKMKLEYVEKEIEDIKRHISYKNRSSVDFFFSEIDNLVKYREHLTSLLIETIGRKKFNRAKEVADRIATMSLFDENGVYIERE